MTNFTFATTVSLIKHSRGYTVYLTSSNTLQIHLLGSRTTVLSKMEFSVATVNGLCLDVGGMLDLSLL